MPIYQSTSPHSSPQKYHSSIAQQSECLFYLISREGISEHCCCFFQADLDKTLEVWNCHRIRRTTRADLPNGRPFLMYTAPDLYGVNDCFKEVNLDHVDLCDLECVKKTNILCDEVVYRLCAITLEEMRLILPSDPYDMCDLYISLRQEIRDQI